MLSVRSRILPVLGLLVMAPVCAEYLQAYLPDTGDAAVMVGGLLVLGPLYGGAALLIREVAVRTGRGWPGILLMATAFGLLMTAVVDLSLWRESDPDFAYWADLREATLIEPLGLAVYPLVTWVAAHVVYSIGAPLVLSTAIARRHRGLPLLGRVGIGVTAVACVAAALLIRADSGPTPGVLRTVIALAVAGILVGLALTPLGRPLRPTSERGSPAPAMVLVAALVGALVVELVPFTYVGVAVAVIVFGLATWSVSRASRAPGWTLTHVTALACGALTARTVVGFLNPVPPGSSEAAKVVQAMVLLALVLAVSRWAWVRSRT